MLTRLKIKGTEHLHGDVCHRERVDLERLAEQDNLANILFNVYVYHVPCIIQDFLKTGYQWLCEGRSSRAE